MISLDEESFVLNKNLLNNVKIKKNNKQDQLIREKEYNKNIIVDNNNNLKEKYELKNNDNNQSNQIKSFSINDNNRINQIEQSHKKQSFQNVFWKEKDNNINNEPFNDKYVLKYCVKEDRGYMIYDIDNLMDYLSNFDNDKAFLNFTLQLLNEKYVL